MQFKKSLYSLTVVSLIQLFRRIQQFDDLKFKKFVPLILSVFWISCSSLSVYLPASRLENPETTDLTSQFSIDLGLEGGVLYKASSDVSLRPPSLNRPQEGSQSSLLGRFTYPLHPRFEGSLAMHSDFGQIPGYSIGGKYQFFGPTTKTAKKGDSALSLSAQFIYLSHTKTGNQNGNLGPGGYPWDASITVKRPDFGLIYGYRIQNNMLVYGGPFYQFGTIDSQVHQEATSPTITNPDSGGNYSRSDTISVLGAHIGLMFTNINSRDYVCEYVVQKNDFGDGAISSVAHRLNFLIRIMGRSDLVKTTAISDQEE